VRGIKPDVFEIYRDGTLLDQTASGEYQDHLEKFILKLNYKSFTQIVILGSASFTPFMQLKASDRREVIEDLLDIQIFSRMNKLVKAKLSTLTLDRNANKLLIEGAIEKIAMQERYIAEAMQDANVRIKEHEHEVAQNRAEISRLLKVIDESSTAIVALDSKILDKAKVALALKKITQLETQVETVLSKHKKTSKFYETEEKCPTCAQVIDALFKTEQFALLGIKIGECETGLVQLEQKFLEAQKRMAEISAVEQEKAKLVLTIANHRTSVVELEKFNTKLKEKIEGFKTQHHSTGREQERLAELLAVQASLE
jgi:DNA repair exonuclease SbcCD ATPase subunit